MAAYHLAVDIGASSGRHMIGWMEDGKIRLKEIYRFENRLIHRNNHLCWDIDHLYEEVLQGIKACKEQGYIPETMGIDTWAVDYVLLDKEGNRLGDAVSYRDDRTNAIRDELEQKGILSFEEHYSRTGIQYQKFNTVYQLLALKKEEPELLDQAECLLMIPDYLNYRLTGKKVQEYTNATTTGLVNADTNTWEEDLIRRLDIPFHIFAKISPAGTILGDFSDEIQQKTAELAYNQGINTDYAGYMASRYTADANLAAALAGTGAGVYNNNQSAIAALEAAIETARGNKDTAGITKGNKVLEEQRTSDERLNEAVTPSPTAAEAEAAIEENKAKKEEEANSKKKKSGSSATTPMTKDQINLYKKLLASNGIYI